MSERIDIVIPNATDLPRFTVDHTQQTVQLQYPVGPDLKLYNGDHAYTFAQGDNFTILSFGIIMPLSFQFDRRVTLGNTPIFAISFYGVGQTSGNGYYFNEISSQQSGYLYITVENYDIALDLFIDLQNQPPAGIAPPTYIKNEEFNLNMEINFNVYPFSGIGISMAGVPASLDGTVQTVTPYMKLLHNYPMGILP
jgi:hypothetical protein